MALSKADLASIAAMIAAATGDASSDDDTPTSRKTSTRAKSRKVSVPDWQGKFGDLRVSATQARQSASGTNYKSTRAVFTFTGKDGSKAGQPLTMPLPLLGYILDNADDIRESILEPGDAFATD